MSESDPSANRAAAVGAAPVVESVPSAKAISSDEAVDYAQLGHATTRLLHDFKNQLGGLKLYTSFLKTQLAGNPDAAEIVEKIMQGLDSMADNATLVGRMARPVELRRESGDLTSLLRKVVADQKAGVDARGISINLELPESEAVLDFDWQQMQIVLVTVIQRAIGLTPAAGTLQINYSRDVNQAKITVTDHGAPLNDLQLSQFFSLLTNERMNKTALDFAFAARVMKAHGGWAAVRRAESGATQVELVLQNL